MRAGNFALDANLSSIVEWLKTLFANEFDQLTRVPPRNITRLWDFQHTDFELLITATNGYDVVQLYWVR